MTTATILYFDGNQIISTRVNADGYPEHTGKALNKFFNSPELAKTITSSPEIRFIDDNTGEIETFNDSRPSKTFTFKEGIKNHEVISYMTKEISDQNYGYIFDDSVREGHWRSYKSSPNLYGTLINDYGLDQYEDDPPQNPTNFDMEELDENYTTKWKNFLNEEEESEGQITGKVKATLKSLLKQLKSEPKENVKLYLASVYRDIKRGDGGQYEDMSIEDMIEDYENYIQEKSDI
jgi:hypothetical protein